MISECALLLYAVSYHLNTNVNYEKVHPSVAIQCNESPIGKFSAGYFRNSLKDDSFYAAKRWGGDGWLELGLSTGYDFVAPVVPVLRVGYTFKWAEVFLALGGEKVDNLYSVKPSFKPLGIVGLQLRYSF